MEFSSAWPVLLAIGVLVGRFALPSGVNLVLSRAYDRSERWWRESLEAYLEFREAHQGRQPSLSSRGEERALALWVNDACCMAKVGLLTHERAKDLEDRDVGIDAQDAKRSEAQQKKCYTFKASLVQKVLCSVGFALYCGFVSLLGLSYVSCFALIVCGYAMAVAVVCDIKARVIPLECCATIALAGSVFQVMIAGFEGVFLGGIAAIVIVGGCYLVARLGEKSQVVAIGQGDVRCMVALALTCGASVPIGLCACYLSAGMYSLGGMMLRKFTSRDGIPMAPYFFVWLIFSVGALAA